MIISRLIRLPGLKGIINKKTAEKLFIIQNQKKDMYELKHTYPFII